MMLLKSVDYKQFENKPNEWHLEECSLNIINLFVGKNASGKTMTLNIIRSLADLLSRHRKLPFSSGNYRVKFSKNRNDIEYVLEYENSEVINETLKIDNDILLERGPSGEGKIFAKEIRRKIKFQVPNDEIAAFVKRDAIQHPFFQDLYNWGDNLVHFYFGTSLGRDFFEPLSEISDIKKKLDIRNTKSVGSFLKIGESQIGAEFINEVRDDMSTIGYNLDNIKLGPISGITIKVPSIEGILIKETDLEYDIEQQSISQGMFRALSLIIQLNFAFFTQKPSCIMVDDIGEGLDYDRSSKLIKLLINKAIKNDVQLIMTTNDRFIMNNVPLKYWSVIVRKGNKSKIYNYRNARKIFEDFELTGLNNFDFFSSNYFLNKF